MAQATESRYNEAARRLGQYRPFEEGGRDLHALLCELSVAVAEINGGTISDLGVCQAGFRDLWHLEVEIDELRAVRETLVREGQAETAGGGFRLRASTRSALDARAKASEGTEQRAFAQWEAVARNLRPDLTRSDLDCLREDLNSWLTRIVTRHGAEAALLLYPDAQRTRQLFEDIDELGTRFLPTRSQAASAIREEAFRRFVREPTDDQQEYLASRLNTAFFLTVLTLDPAAKSLTQEDARGSRLYLDTNFLYAVLGLASAHEVLSATRLLALTREMGYELAITPWTVQELDTSIKSAQREADGYLVRPGIGALMAKVTGEKGFGQGYWHAVAQTGITVKDYFGRASQFKLQLEELDIQVIDQGCAAVDRMEAGISDYASLLEGILGPGKRNRDVIEHDAKHRLLIERLRGDGSDRFSNARYWFLTQDTRLPFFARCTTAPDHAIPAQPFCIAPSLWLQIVRALTPRTENFEDTIVGLLTSPYVGFRGPVNERVVREVVARMDQEDGSPELAYAVLKDTATVRDIGEAESPEDLEIRVRAAYSTKTRELEEQAAASAELAAKESAARVLAETRAAEVASDLLAETRRREGLESDVSRLRGQRDEDRVDLTQRLDDEAAARSQFEQTVHDREARRTAVFRLVIAALVALADCVATFFILHRDVVESTPAVVACVFTAVLVFALCIKIGLGRWANTALTLIGIGLAGVGIVLTIILAHTSS